MGERPLLKSVDQTPPPQARAPNVELVRTDPPEAGHTRVRIEMVLADVLAQVEADPGQWYRICTWTGYSSAHSAARTLKERRPGLEYRPGRLPDGGSGLWARSPAEASDR